MRQHVRIVLFLALILLMVMTGCRNADDSGSAGGVQPPAEGTDGAAQESEPSVEGAAPGTAPGAAQIEFSAAPIIVSTDLIDPPATQRITPGTAVTHRVVQGEWLLQIARCYGASYTAVRQANPLNNPNRIIPGSTIVIPNPGSDGPIAGPPCLQTVTVQPGDTWATLAQRYQTTAAILMQANPGGLAVGRQITVPVVAVPVSRLPLLTHDLIFNLDGNVAVWRSRDGRLELSRLDAYVLDIVTEPTGRWVLLKQTRDGGATVEVALLDRTSRRMSILQRGLLPEPAGVPGETMLLSPDGARGVYLARDAAGVRATVFETAAPAVRSSVQVVGHGNNDAQPPQLFAGDDNQHFLWLDEAGIFRFDYALEEGERRLVAVSPQAVDVPQSFLPVAWSPQGRFLLLQGFFNEGGAYFVLDAQTGALRQLPDSTSYVTVSAVSWLPDGAAVVFSPPFASNSGPQVATYRPVPADGDLTLAEVSKVTLPAAEADSGSSGYIITAPAEQRRAGQVAMTLQAGNTAVDGVWVLPVDGDTPQRLAALSPSVYSVRWTPDGSGLLLEEAGPPGRAGDVLYLDLADERPFSLAAWLGLKMADFHWSVR